MKDTSVHLDQLIGNHGELRSFVQSGSVSKDTIGNHQPSAPEPLHQTKSNLIEHKDAKLAGIINPNDQEGNCKPAQQIALMPKSTTSLPSFGSKGGPWGSGFISSFPGDIVSHLGHDSHHDIFGTDGLELFPGIDGNNRSPSLGQKRDMVSPKISRFETKRDKVQDKTAVSFFSSAIWSDHGAHHLEHKDDGLLLNNIMGNHHDIFDDQMHFMRQPSLTGHAATTPVSTELFRVNGQNDKKDSQTTGAIRKKRSQQFGDKFGKLFSLSAEGSPVSMASTVDQDKLNDSKIKLKLKPQKLSVYPLLPSPKISDVAPKTEESLLGPTSAMILDPLWATVHMMPPLAVMTKTDHYATQLARIVYDLSSLTVRVQSIMDSEANASDQSYDDDTISMKIFLGSDPTVALQNFQSTGSPSVLINGSPIATSPMKDSSNASDTSPDTPVTPGKRKRSYSRSSKQRGPTFAPSVQSQTAIVTPKVASYILHNVGMTPLSALLKSTLLSPSPRSSGVPTNINAPEDESMDRTTLKRLRNRVSASRCRLKKRIGLVGMEQCSKALEILSGDLEKHIKALEEERELLMRVNALATSAPSSSQQTQ